MARYTIPFTKDATSVLQLVDARADATRPRRAALTAFEVGCETAADDGLYAYVIRRVTNAGTGTSVTPQPTDPADAATEFDALNIITVDASSFAAGTLLSRRPLNGRSTWHWQDAGPGLIWPATASNGLSLGLTAASTKLFGGTLYLTEY